MQCRQVRREGQAAAGAWLECSRLSGAVVARDRVLVAMHVYDEFDNEAACGRRCVQVGRMGSVGVS